MRHRLLAVVGLLLLAGCAPAGELGADPILGETVAVVPGASLPAEVIDQDSNNNLDIAWFDDRLFLAFRTAPNHFASADTVLYVLSTTDQVNWTYETSFAMDTDLREPRFLAWDGRLFLYFAVLGDDPLDFTPQGALGVERLGEGDWTEPVDVFEPGFIGWRARAIDGVPYVIGYTGGEGIYDAATNPLHVYWLTSTDGWTWTGVDPDQPVVLTGGVSETDWVFQDDGSVVAVGRNEAGDEDGFGSKICRASADALADWTCNTDTRKYDSPLMFRHGEDIWLVARRNVTETGDYDLGYDGTPGEQSAAYALDYWQQPKRCAMWRVDPDALTVSWVLDLPSRGDTCFASALQVSPWETEIYNYSSPVDGPDLSWLEGQLGQTLIYRTEVGW